MLKNTILQQDKLKINSTQTSLPSRIHFTHERDNPKKELFYNHHTKSSRTMKTYKKHLYSRKKGISTNKKTYTPINNRKTYSRTPQKRHTHTESHMRNPTLSSKINIIIAIIITLLALIKIAIPRSLVSLFIAFYIFNSNLVSVSINIYAEASIVPSSKPNCVHKVISPEHQNTSPPERTDSS